jgi:hypothetical protein
VRVSRYCPVAAFRGTRSGTRISPRGRSGSRTSIISDSESATCSASSRLRSTAISVSTLPRTKVPPLDSAFSTSAWSDSWSSTRSVSMLSYEGRRVYV